MLANVNSIVPIDGGLFVAQACAQPGVVFDF
jgi:hypothetical protein